jgi:hypothetical protein
MSEIANIKIDNSYFLKSRNEYSNPIEWIWFREAIQNSSDAKAKNININIEYNVVTFEDDGYGMDENIILNKLLTLGGSQKDSDSVGGFGKAKEILFYTWQKWSISSNKNGTNYYIDNSMIGKSPIRKSLTSSKNGTTISITIDDNMLETYWLSNAESFIGTCKSSITFRLNGEIIPTSTLRGRYADFDWASIMTNKTNKSYTCYVRMGGITMFTMRLAVPLTAVIELKGTSVETMNSSRENLRYEYREKFESFIADLNINPNESTRKKNQSQTIYFVGDSLAEKIKNMILECKELLAAQGHDVDELAYSMDSIASGVVNIHDIKAKVAEMNLPQRISEDIDGVIKENSKFFGKMGYQYIVRLEGVQKPYMDPNARNAQTILHMWTKIVMYLGKKTSNPNLSVGLIFRNKEDDEQCRGLNIYFHEKEYILINPMIVRSIKNPIELGLQLFPVACHEVAHHKEQNHNEDFTSLYGTYLQFLSEDWDELRKMFIQAKMEASSSI